MPSLTVEHRGRTRGVVLAGRVLIGRWRGCGLPVGHPTVSRLHAWIDREDEHFYIGDVDSRTGTIVNGQPLREHHALQDGDQIVIGPALLVYHESSELAAGVEAVEVGENGAAHGATTSGILFPCKCGAPLWTSVNLAGRMGRCRFCQQRIRIPKASVVLPSPQGLRNGRPDSEAPPAPVEQEDESTITPQRPATPGGDQVDLSDEELVEIGSRPATEEGFGSGTFVGFDAMNAAAAAAAAAPAAPVAAREVATAVERPAMRKPPVPRPREVAAELSVDHRVDVPSDSAAEPLSGIEQAWPVKSDIDLPNVSAGQPSPRMPRAASPLTETAPVCGVCQSPVFNDDQKTVCPICGVSYHPECWEQNRGCSSQDCPQQGILNTGSGAGESAAGHPSGEADGYAGAAVSDSAARGGKWLAAVFIGTLVGLLGFGLPPLVVAIADLVSFVRTRPQPAALRIATMLLALGGAFLGLCASMQWWLKQPIIALPGL